MFESATKMAATMIEVAFVYEDTKFSLILQKEAVTKLYEDSEYMKNFFTELKQHTTLWSEMGLPGDVDVDKIRLAKSNAALICSGKNIYVIPRQQEVVAKPAESEAVESDQTGKGLNVWTDNMIKLLISTRLEMNDQFNLSIPKKILWARIAQIMAEKGYLVTADGCDVKWRNLLITYRKNKAKAQESGDDAIVWPYYSLLDDGLSRMGKSNPPAGTVLASLPTDATDDPDRDTLSPLSDQSTRSTSTSPITCSMSLQLAPSPTFSSSPSALKNAHNNSQGKVKRLKCAIEDEPPTWLVRYIKKVEEVNRRRDAIEERRWTALAKREEHKIQIEEKKLQAMYALIETLKK